MTEYGLEIFGAGFAIWAFYVRQGALALKDVKNAMMELVDLRLTGVQDKMDNVVNTLQTISATLVKLERDYEKRISLLEQRQHFMDGKTK